MLCDGLHLALAADVMATNGDMRLAMRGEGRFCCPVKKCRLSDKEKPAQWRGLF